MRIAEFSVRRHVLAFMLSAVLVLFGIVAFNRIGIDRYPNIDQPVISVSTALDGATPEVMDSSVTQVIESAVNSVPGIDYIESTSRAGRSTVRINFKLDKNVDVAFNEVQVKVNQAQRRLPDDADAPVVSKTDANASPIIWLGLTGDRTPKQLYDYANTVIKKQLETLDGVGEIMVRGRGERVIRVDLDPVRLAGFGLTPTDVSDAIKREHRQAPGGTLKQGDREYQINLNLEYGTVDALQDLVVGFKGQTAVRLADVAQVVDGESEVRSITRFNGEPGINIGVVRVSGSNMVSVADNVLAKVRDSVLPALPPGMTLSVASNDSTFVLEMVAALEDHLLEGTLLAALVVWLFLRNLRSTLIVSLAIPVSLLGAVALMYFLGYTFNTITLLALLLLIGVVVDDAIVVIENIWRLREEGETDPMQAAIDGSQQVVFAVIAATLSLVAIFAPVVFLSGLIGRLFNSFAVVVASGVLVSLFVSVTLTPMLASRWLKTMPKHGPLYRRMESGFIALENGYRRLLAWTLAHRLWVMGAALVCVAASALIFTSMKSEFLPEEDEARFLVSLKTPIGASVDYTDRKTRAVEDILNRYPEVSNTLAIVGGFGGGQVNQTTLIVRLKPRSERAASQGEVLARARKDMGRIAGVRAAAFPFPRIGESRGGKLQFAVIGPTLADTSAAATRLTEALGNDPRIGRLDTDVELQQPQLAIDIDRAAAARYGLSTQTITDAIDLLSAGKVAARFSENGERYDIEVKAAESALTRPESLGAVYLRGSKGDLVRLDSVARVRPMLGASQIQRQSLQYAVQLKGSPTLPLAEAVALTEATAAEVLAPNIRIEWLGEARELDRTAGQLVFTFAFASLLLYMVLASQFNSFLQPALVMLAEPLAVVGGLLLLWLTGQSLNVYSVIGLILLIGLVAKNAILLIDVTNQSRAAGRRVDSALAESCPRRLRPVLMTSLTVVLAMLPAAMGFGAGAETNGPLAIAVIGGMVSSTLLTLVVIPAAYSLLEGWREQRRLR